MLTINNYDNRMRVGSLTADDMKELPWLEPVLRGNFSSLQFPEMPKNTIRKYDFLCEEDSKNGAGNEKQSQNPMGFSKKLNEEKNDIEIKYYQMNPILLKNSDECKYDSGLGKNPKMKYIQINSVNFDNSSISLSMATMQFFVYNDGPITEPVQIKLDKNGTVFSTYTRNLKKIIIPYVNSPKKSILVFVLFMRNQDEIKPFGIGTYQIKKTPKIKIIEPNWCSFDQSLTIEQHFQKKSNLNMNISFETEIVDNPNGEIIKLTSKYLFYPSPLLTISNIQLDIKPKKERRKNGGLLFVRISLKSMNESGKGLEKIPSCFVSPEFLQPSDSGSTSSIQCKEDRKSVV